MERTKPPTRATTRRFVVYMDPMVCPACGEKATTVFGARRYCAACADWLSTPPLAQAA